MPNRLLSFLFERPAAPPAAKTGAKGGAQHIAVLAGEREIAVKVRRHPRARRFTLRLTARGDGAVVTIPDRGSFAQAQSFVHRHAGWLAERLSSIPSPSPDGAVEEVLLRGEPHRVLATGSSRGLVSVAVDADGLPVLRVPGGDGHLRRRLVDHLKREARRDLLAAVDHHAAKLGVVPSSVRLKDTTSRWGSASSSGALCFSWRLIMAPPSVLDYVAAHEVAHLREMNHSDRFWAICRRLAPQTEEAQDWLKANGRRLHRVL